MQNSANQLAIFFPNFYVYNIKTWFGANFVDLDLIFKVTGRVLEVIEGLLVRDSLEAMCYVLEQDILWAA